MAKIRYNHERKIENTQYGNLKLLQKGMVVSFNYKSSNIFDKRPLILFLYREKNIIHGINLNYLDNYKFKRLFKVLGNENKIEEKDESASKKLSEDYTRINLPTFKRERDGDKLSKSEAKVEGKKVYKKTLKPKILGDDVYRTYSVKKMSSIKIVNIKGEQKLVKGKSGETNEEVEDNENKL